MRKLEAKILIVMKVHQLFLVTLMVMASCKSLEDKLTSINGKRQGLLDDAKEFNENSEELVKAKRGLAKTKELSEKYKSGQISYDDFVKKTSDEDIEDPEDPETPQNDEADSVSDEGSEVTFDPTDFTAKDIISILDTIQNRDKKYTLNPDSTFFGFSTGASFEFVDGIDDASLFLDLNANLGQVLHPRVTAEFGVLSGKFSANEDSKNINISEPLSIVQNPDSSFTLNLIEGNLKENQKNQKQFTRGFATINFRLGPRSGNMHSNSKLYLTSSFNYNRIEFRNSIERNFTPFDTVPSSTVSTRATEFDISLRDTLKANIVQDRNSAFIGLKLFKEAKNFEFFINGLFGYTWIKQIRSDLTSTSGERVSSLSPLTLNISQGRHFTYLFQGSVLEKKIVGAKIGFEIRDLMGDSTEAPDYFFFISKQFSMTEFFRLFTPSSE